MPAVNTHVAENGRPRTSELVGASSFSDLVRAHFRREQERAKGNSAAAEAEQEFEAALAHFQDEEGKVIAAYWSTRDASAVALTVGHARSKRNPIVDTDAEVRLHRLTDWVTREAEPIAELLHDCDVLAIRVREVLRGTSERIAMQWLYSVQEHALGFLERSESRQARRREALRHEAAARAGADREVLPAHRREGRPDRLRLGNDGGGDRHRRRRVRCSRWCSGRADTVGGRRRNTCSSSTSAGAVGALISVLSRMSGGDDRFTVDFEVGRPLLRRLGLYKPLVGAVFGVATYFLLAAGLLPTKTTDGRPARLLWSPRVPGRLQRALHRGHLRQRGTARLRRGGRACARRARASASIPSPDSPE